MSFTPSDKTISKREYVTPPVQRQGQQAVDDPAWVSPPSLPMYLAAFIVTVCGLFAATEYLADDPFSHLIYGLTILGFIVSFVSRHQNVSPRNIELPALIICGCVFLTGLFSDQPFLAPASIGDDRHRSLAVLLTWLTVFRSYTLINDGALLFCCVPTIALIGLISTNLTDSSLLTTFIVFVAAASFLMVHENFLRTRTTRTHMKRSRSQSSMVGSQLQVAGVCVAASVVLANIVVVPLRNLLNQVQISAGIPTINRTSTSTTTVTPLNIAETPEVRIGNGPVSMSDQVVMRVQADLADPYWRGTTFNLYTSHGWRNELPSSPISGVNTVPNEEGAGVQKFEYRISPTPLTTTGGPHRTSKQKVLLQGAVFDSLYAVSEPRALILPQSQATIDPAGTLHFGSVNAMEYEVDSEVSTASPSDLRMTGSDYPSDIRKFYLQMPANEEMVGRWRQTASEATKGLTSAFDRVSTLSQWIGNRCQYNLKADAVPADQDVVDTFLFKQKQGYCDSFASSLAMLCRSIGIPSRVASGFLTGERDSFKHEFVVRERDKHQWTEVYFTGIGWVKFDPTEFAENITPQDGSKGPKGKSLLALLFGRGWVPPAALAAFIAMLAYVVKVELWDRFRRKKQTADRLALPVTNIAVIDHYDAACASLAKLGLRKRVWETATEFRQRANSTLKAWPNAQDHLDRITTLVITSRYSGEEALTDDVRLAREAASALATALRSIRRRELESAIAALETGA